MNNVLTRIIEAVTCNKHSADLGQPCFEIPASETELIPHRPIGICNHRARRFGCTGKISKESLIKVVRR